MNHDDYTNLARRVLLRLAPLTDAEQARIARYAPDVGGIILIINDPDVMPLLERAYPDAIKVYIGGVIGDDTPL